MGLHTGINGQYSVLAPGHTKNNGRSGIGQLLSTLTAADRSILAILAVIAEQDIEFTLFQNPFLIRRIGLLPLYQHGQNRT